MKVFVSWSGELSHKVAAHLKVWLEDVLQGSIVWISSENIEKGSVWFSDVSDTLKDTTFGVLCVTQINISAPWLLFEAGALSKGLSTSRVSPLLIDITPADLKPPLSLLNATLPTEDDMFRLIKTINAHSDGTRLPEDRLERAFRRFWPEFGAGFEKILNDASVTKPIPKRSDREILEEVAEISKSVFRAMPEAAVLSRELGSLREHEIEARQRENLVRAHAIEIEERYNRLLEERAALMEKQLTAERRFHENAIRERDEERKK